MVARLLFGAELRERQCLEGGYFNFLFDLLELEGLLLAFVAHGQVNLDVVDQTYTVRSQNRRGLRCN